MRRQEDAHESVHEGVGEKVFPRGEDAAEVLSDARGEFGHGREQKVSGVEDSNMAEPGTQTAARLSVVGADVDVLKGQSHPLGLGRAQDELAHAFVASALGLGAVFGILHPEVAAFFLRSPQHGSRAIRGGGHGRRPRWPA